MKSQSEVKFEIMIFNKLSDFEILKKSPTVVCQQDMKDWLHVGGCTNVWSLLVFLFCVGFYLGLFQSNLEISRKFAPVVFACEKKGSKQK